VRFVIDDVVVRRFYVCLWKCAMIDQFENSSAYCNEGFVEFLVTGYTLHTQM
jgi:hypothetical protein